MPRLPLPGSALPSIPVGQPKAARARVVFEKRPGRSDFVRKLHERLTYQTGDEDLVRVAIARDELQAARSTLLPSPAHALIPVATLTTDTMATGISHRDGGRA